MEEREVVFRGIIFKGIGSIILLYLVFMPVLYGVILNEIRKPNNTSLIFVAIKSIRFFLVIFIGLYIRNKNKDILENNKGKSGKYFIAILCAICVSGLLYLQGIPHKIYIHILGVLGIYDWKSTYKFIYIFVEEMFDNHMVISILLCLAIIFSYRPMRNVLSQKNES